MSAALYCEKGHFIEALEADDDSAPTDAMSAMFARKRSGPPPFCRICGAMNTSTCAHCQVPIELSYDRPAFCAQCGKAFPWTVYTIRAASECTDDIADLTGEEKDALKATFEDLTIDTARTPLAADRYRSLIAKAKGRPSQVLQKIMENSVSAETRKLLEFGEKELAPPVSRY
jgi:hypothetical protein